MYEPRYSKAGGLLGRPGRPVGPNPSVRHLSREIAKPGAQPVVLKVRRGLSLDGAAVEREVAKAFEDGQARSRFRLAGWKLHGDHAHVSVEAKTSDELGDAMKSVTSLFAHAVNRALGRRGAVLGDRYRLLAPEKPGVKRQPCGCPLRPAPRPARSARPR